MLYSPFKFSRTAPYNFEEKTLPDVYAHIIQLLYKFYL